MSKSSILESNVPRERRKKVEKGIILAEPILERRKEIRISMEGPIHTCIYVEQFQFRQCTIKTCKNYTPITTSKCLAIDRVQPVGNKIISDAELHLYKYSSEKVSTRLISLKRKKAITRVKAILILHSLLEYIRENYKPKGRVWDGSTMMKAESEYPLKVRRLQFKNWMWPYLVSKKVWNKFATKKGGECAAFKPHMLLNLDRESFDSLIAQFKQLKEEGKLNERSRKPKTSLHRRTGNVKKLLRVGKEHRQPAG